MAAFTSENHRGRNTHDNSWSSVIDLTSPLPTEQTKRTRDLSSSPARLSSAESPTKKHRSATFASKTWESSPIAAEESDTSASSGSGDDGDPRPLAIMVPPSASQSNMPRSQTPEYSGRKSTTQVRWTTEQDGELLRLRERVVGEPLWEDIYALFRHIFPDFLHSTGALQRRYQEGLSRNAPKLTQHVHDCTEMRAKAVSYLKTTTWKTPTREKRTSRPVDKGGMAWNIWEDAELIRLRERTTMKFAWAAVLERFVKSFPNTPRTPLAVKSRYATYLSPDAHNRSMHNTDCVRIRAKTLAFLSNIDKSSTYNESKDSNYNDKATTRADVEPQDLQQRKALQPLKIDWNLQCANISNFITMSSENNSDDGDESSYLYDDDVHAIATDEVSDAEDNSESDNDTGCDSDSEVDSETDSQGDKGDDSESDDDVENDLVHVLVGEHHEVFSIPLNSIKGNTSFIGDAQAHPEGYVLITGSRWAQLRPESFRPIYEFLKYGDYDPELCEEKLEGVKSEEDRWHEALRCGAIFGLARRLQVGKMLGLIVDKYSTLGKKEPLHALMVAKSIFGEADSGTEAETRMRKFLVDDVVESYGYLIRDQPRSIDYAMGRLPELHAAVMRELQKKQEAGKGKGEGLAKTFKKAGLGEVVEWETKVEEVLKVEKVVRLGESMNKPIEVEKVKEKMTIVVIDDSD